MAQWCNPLTLKSEQSGGVGSRPGRTTPLERHNKGSLTRLGLLYFCDLSLALKIATSPSSSGQFQGHIGAKSSFNDPTNIVQDIPLLLKRKRCAKASSFYNCKVEIFGNSLAILGRICKCHQATIS